MHRLRSGLRYNPQPAEPLPFSFPPVGAASYKARMSEDAVQITARGRRADAEAAAQAIDSDALLEGATYSILEEDEDRGVWRIDAFPVDEAEVEAFGGVLGRFSGLTVRAEALADADWLAMALSGLPPVRAGRFFVYGLHDRGRAPPNAVNLRIEAGAAFGTGHHGTTVGCLIAYDRLLKRRRFEKVLDVGAGTGVLAIAAARTGSRVVVGTDIDAVSVRISRENASVNRARVGFVHAAGLAAPAVRAHAPYDLVFANILARPLVSLAQDIKGALKPGGRAILSGLLRTQERFVRAAYLDRGFRLEFAIRRDAWATLVLQRG
jgi:ribosomal protein L11 methyltransferase